MNKKMFGLIILVGGILPTLAGALWAIRALPSQAAQPLPPIAELLLRDSDLPGREFGYDECGQKNPEEMAREMAEFIGLSPDYSEGRAVCFVVYSPSPPPFKAVAHGLYLYKSNEEAIAHYEHLLEALPLTPLGRETPIISRSEWSFKGVKGQIIETQDPIGTAYWFIGVRGKLLTAMVALSFERAGQPFFEELLPIALGRMTGPQ